MALPVAPVAKRKRSGEPEPPAPSESKDTAWSLPKFEPRPSIIGLSATEAVAALKKAQAKGIAVSQFDLYSGWFNLGICSLFFMTLRICIGNLQKYGVLVDFSVMMSLIGTIEQWPACLAVAAMLFTVSLSLLVELRLRAHVSGIKRYFVHLVLSMLQLLQTCTLVVCTIDNIAVGICVTFIAGVYLCVCVRARSSPSLQSQCPRKSSASATSAVCAPLSTTCHQPPPSSTSCSPPPSFTATTTPAPPSSSGAWLRISCCSSCLPWLWNSSSRCSTPSPVCGLPRCALPQRRLPFSPRILCNSCARRSRGSVGSTCSLLPFPRCLFATFCSSITSSPTVYL